MGAQANVVPGPMTPIITTANRGLDFGLEARVETANRSQIFPRASPHHDTIIVVDVVVDEACAPGARCTPPYTNRFQHLNCCGGAGICPRRCEPA